MGGAGLDEVVGRGFDESADFGVDDGGELGEVDVGALSGRVGGVFGGFEFDGSGAVG